MRGHGISLVVNDVVPAGDTLVNGVVGSEITYTDNTKQWLTGLPDLDNFDTWNWLQCGPAPEPGASDPDLSANRNSIVPYRL